MNDKLIDWKHFNVSPMGHSRIGIKEKQTMRDNLMDKRNPFIFNVWQDIDSKEIYLLDHPIYISLLYDLELKKYDIPESFAVNYIEGEYIEEAFNIFKTLQEEKKEKQFLKDFEVMNLDHEKLEINEDYIKEDYENLAELLEANENYKKECPNCGYPL